MASLYAKYIGERTDDCIWETGAGFATYRYVEDGNAVYIIDIYVLPDARKSGHAAMIADEIAKVAPAPIGLAIVQRIAEPRVQIVVGSVGWVEGFFEGRSVRFGCRFGYLHRIHVKGHVKRCTIIVT